MNEREEAQFMRWVCAGDGGTLEEWANAEESLGIGKVHDNGVWEGGLHV